MRSLMGSWCVLSLVTCSALAVGTSAQDLGIGDTQTPGSIGADVAADTSASTTAETVNQMPELKAAYALFVNQQFQDAEDKLTELCRANPKLPPPGIILGTWHFKAKQPGFARAAFERAVRDNPEDPEAYVVFGDNALGKRRYTDAILLYREALKHLETYNGIPERKKTLLLRANGGAAAVFETRENWAKAKAALTKVLAIDPNNVVALTRMGHVLFREGEEAADAGNDALSKKRLNEAYEVFQRVYETDPSKMVRYEINMARLYQATDKDKNAEKLYLKALERDPQGLQTHLAVAQWGLETGRMDLVKKVSAAAEAIDPNAVAVLILKGVLNRSQENYPQAEAALRKAHVEAPSNPIVLNQLALCVGSQDGEEKLKQALEFSQMATRMFPDDNQPFGREAKVTLAWLLNKRSGGKQQAVQVLTQALRAGPVGPESAYFAAVIFADNGKPDIARQMLESALKNTKSIFPARKLAEAMLQKLKATAGSEASSSDAPSSP